MSECPVHCEREQRAVYRRSVRAEIINAIRWDINTTCIMT